MFCPVCGNALETGLNFCNRCGHELAPVTASGAAENLANGATATAVFGFLVFGLLMWMFLKSEFPATAIVFIALFYLAGLFAICWSILRYTATVAGTRRLVKPANGLAQLGSPTASQLFEARERPASVTENTTRTLDTQP
jgi:hypothetical protein